MTRYEFRSMYIDWLRGRKLTEEELGRLFYYGERVDLENDRLKQQLVTMMEATDA